MARYPLFGVDTAGKSVHYSAQRRINLYAELKKDGDRSRLAFYQRPGMTLFDDLGDTPVRGMHAMGAFLYVVHRGTFWEIDSNGDGTSRGTIGTTSGRVDMDDNGTQLILVDSASGYTYTPGTTTFATISDGDFNAAFTVAFLAGRFVLEKTGSGQFFISASYDGTAYDATEIASAESFPDDLIRVFVDHGEIILFGSESTEFWGSVGAVDFPFAPIQGTPFEWGLAARWSVVKYDDAVAFLAQNRSGEVQAMQISGYRPKRISNEEVEYHWNGYSTVSDATGISYVSAGHPFYQLNFPTAAKSWIYNGSIARWMEAEYGTSGARHRAEIGEQFGTKILVSDYSDGKIFQISQSALDDNGVSFAKELIGRHIIDEREISIGRLWLDIESGVGTATGEGDNPQVMLSTSKDGGRTYGPERWASIGEIGRYRQRAIWRRLGRALDWTFRVRVSDPVKVTISGAWVDTL